jgi:hypothetical protein
MTTLVSSFSSKLMERNGPILCYDKVLYYSNSNEEENWKQNRKQPAKKQRTGCISSVSIYLYGDMRFEKVFDRLLLCSGIHQDVQLYMQNYMVCIMKTKNPNNSTSTLQRAGYHR